MQTLTVASPSLHRVSGHHSQPQSSSASPSLSQRYLDPIQPLQACPLSPASQSPDTATTDHPLSFEKRKRKRNKPTLSCTPCVNRKIKCDRARPVCDKCAAKHVQCIYNPEADRRVAARPTVRSIQAMDKPAKRENNHSPRPSPIENAAVSLNLEDALPSPRQRPKLEQLPNNETSSFSLPNVPAATSTPSNIFGIGKQYPFSNYWTCTGGIAEVVGVLPSKEQADILVARFFEAMHPVYPFLHRRSFYTRYERFWSSSPSERLKADADMLALHYTVYALGTQFMELPSYRDAAASAEFYASASNQALRIYSYLNRASLESLSAMLMLAYFLMNDNHASDAFAWSGVLLRQAYALKLHRDPDAVVPNASQMEKQARRKLWQAIFFSDTFLTILLRLPPSCTTTDVEPDSLVDEATLMAQGIVIEVGMTSRVENLMSISVIAPPDDGAMPPVIPRDPMGDRRDVEYIRSMWKLGIFVQQNIAAPYSLDCPLVSVQRSKSSLIAKMESLYATCPPSLTNTDDSYFCALGPTDSRTMRQNLFLNSNYHHCLMLLHSAENLDAGITCNVQDTLHAAHAAIGVFFKLWRYFKTEAGTWWVFHHRAFEEALMIARMLSAPCAPAATLAVQQLYVACKADVFGVIDLIRRCDNGNSEMQKGRLDMLEKAVRSIVLTYGS